MIKNDYLYNATVTRVVDGDTIDVIIDLGFSITFKTRMRLEGLDAMETNDKDPTVREMGLKAKKFLTDLLTGEEVTLVSHKPDKYGRYLATIYLDGISVNLQLLKEGLAVSYNGGKKVQQLNIPLI